MTDAANDPWAEFRSTPPQTIGGGDPWAAFRPHQAVADPQPAGANVPTAAPTIVKRGTILPLAEYSDGSARFDWDSGIAAPVGAFKRMLENPQTVDSPLDPAYVRDAATVALGMTPVTPSKALPAVTSRSMPTVATPQSAAIADARSLALSGDVAAFERQGVRPFGPAFGQGPTASVAKQLSETPIIGAPLKNALDESIIGAGQAVERVADDIGAGRTFDQSGATVTRGLERFGSSRLDDLEPEISTGLGIPPRSAVASRETMSDGARRVAQDAAPIRREIGADVTQTTRGATFAAGREPATRERFLTRRTGVEELSDDQLSRVVRAPSAQTSFATRAEALYERAFRYIPALTKENGSSNPNMLSPVNTRQALGQIERQLANDITGQTVINGPLLERLKNARAGITLSDMRAIRTELGRALGSLNPLQQSLNRQQLSSLYGALSRDIEIGLETIANRVAVQTRSGGTNRATEEQARQAANALRSFRTADRFFRSGMASRERVHTLLQANNPEQASQRLLSAATEGGRGNIGLLRSVRNAIRPEEWSDVSSLVLRELGKPLPSARGTAHEAGFSVATFTTRWNKMDDRSRGLLFDGRHRAAIDDVVRVVSRLAEVEATVNTSRSATNALNVSGILATGGAIATGTGLAGIVGPALAGSAVSILMSRPQYAHWLARYVRARASAMNSRVPNSSVVNSLVIRLEAMSRADPDLLPVVEAVRSDNERRGAQQ